MPKWEEVLNLDVEVFQSLNGSQLNGFLAGIVKKVGPQYLFDGAKEIVVDSQEAVANPNYSLSLLVYAALNPSTVSLGPRFESVIPRKENPKELPPLIDKFFGGTNLALPQNSALDSRFRSFDKWTEIDEVKHISLWLLAAVRGFYSNSVRSGLEIKIPIPGESRPGRLDVVALYEQRLICFEAKTSISEAIKDRRFIEQVPKYRKEIKSASATAGLANTDPLIFLATGGSESDLKAKDYKLNPSAVGKKLLEVCDRHHIKFVTANAIWQLLAIRLIAPERAVGLDQLLKTLDETESFLGLTSAGYITQDEHIVAPIS